MVKPIWLVIEGDNGTGKDELANRLRNDGWTLGSHLLEENEEMSRERSLANVLSGTQRAEAFLKYNSICGRIISAHLSRNVLVRYWPSTLAAAFADAIYEWDEIQAKLDDCLRYLPYPTLFVFLTCQLKTRRTRIMTRGPISGAIDDISETRDRRYREIIQRIIEYSKAHNWKTLDTTDLSKEQVHQKVKSILNELEVVS